MPELLWKEKTETATRVRQRIESVLDWATVRNYRQGETPDNSLVVDAADLEFFKTKFFSSDPDADLTGDNIVNSTDLVILKTMFFSPPGPSGHIASH